MTHIERAYEHADKAISHYQRLLAGAGLTQADKLMFRKLLLRACAARWQAREAIEEATEEVIADEMVMV